MLIIKVEGDLCARSHNSEAGHIYIGGGGGGGGEGKGLIFHN